MPERVLIEPCADQGQPRRALVMVLHLHWHVIARWGTAFPQAVWARASSRSRPDALQRIGLALAPYAVAEALDACVVGKVCPRAVKSLIASGTEGYCCTAAAPTTRYHGRPPP